MIWLFTLIFLSLLFFSFIIYFKYRIKRYKNENIQIKLLVDNLLQHRDNLKQQNSLLTKKVQSHKQLNERFGVAVLNKYNNIKGLITQIQTASNDNSKLLDIIHLHLRVDAQEPQQPFSDLLEVVNTNFNGFASELQARNPK